VTFGGQGASGGTNSTSITSSVSPSHHVAAAANTTAANAASTGPERATKTSSSSPPSEEENVWIDTGGCVSIPVLDANSPTTANTSQQQQQQQQQQRILYWSQDRYSVTIRLALRDDELKISSVQVEGIVSYANRFSATQTDTTTKPRLKIVAAVCQASKTNDDNESKNDLPTTRVIVDDELPYPVHMTEEDEEDGHDDYDGKRCNIDWTIVRKNEQRQGCTTAVLPLAERRYIQFTLYKAVPMYGLFLWWRRPLMQCPEIDVRRQQNGSDGRTNAMSSNNDTQSSEKFLDAWNEAHTIFKNNMKDRKGSL
jgi:hypothetical protein